MRLRVAVGLVRDEQFEHHFPRRPGAVRRRLHLHAGRRRADAACGEHALALDLDHAGAAIAVRAVARLGRVAQMRDVGAVALRDLPDGLARARVHFLAVEREGDGVATLAGAGDLWPARCATPGCLRPRCCRLPRPWRRGRIQRVWSCRSSASPLSAVIPAKPRSGASRDRWPPAGVMGPRLRGDDSGELSSPLA